MHITIFIGSLSGGGAERVACNLANHLSENDCEVTLLTMSQTKEVYPICDSVKRISLVNSEERKNKIKCNILRYIRLKKYIKETQTDCYVVMLPITIALLLHFRKKSKVPMIASERCDPKSYSLAKKFLMKYFGKRADAWMFQTEEAARWYEGIAKKSYVIPNAINPIFIRDLYVSEKEKSIVAAGRLSSQKNFKLLIDAFSRISEAYPEYTLKIYGKGPLETELREYAGSKDLEDRVCFMGYVADMPEQLEKTSLFVLSSDYEGMPNALMEAMALGLPCVSTDCGGGGARFLIEDGVNGLLVPVQDEVAMAEAIKAILSDPKTAAELGKNARKLQDTLAPEKIYGQWEKFIQEVVEECNE